MDFNKYLTDAFGEKCVLTRHAEQRLSERMTFSELKLLKLLVQNVVRNYNIRNTLGQFVLVDDRYNLSMILDRKATELDVVTLIRGKSSADYKGYTVFKGNIKLEEHEQEVDKLRSYIKTNERTTN